MTVATALPLPTAPALPNELRPLLAYLPLWMQEEVVRFLPHGVEELVVQLNRPLMLRVAGGYTRTERIIEREDMAYVRARLAPFRSDNRTGIDGTLHRISATKDRYDDIIGMHIRIGQSVPGLADPLTPLLQGMTRGLLMVGPPRVGKTTLLRDIVRVLASVIKVDPNHGDELPGGVINRFGPSVVVVDNSNELGGDGTDCHPDIGDATRLQVSDPSELARVLLEAVINKSPTHVIGDEIGSKADVEQVRTIAKRGAIMVATVHGTRLQEVLGNPVMEPILGFPDFVNERRRTATTFDLLLEVRGRGAIYAYLDCDAAVDAVLRGEKPNGEWIYLPGHPNYRPPHAPSASAA